MKNNVTLLQINAQLSYNVFFYLGKSNLSQKMQKCPDKELFHFTCVLGLKKNITTVSDKEGNNVLSNY